MARPMSFHILVRREFQTPWCNELKARTAEKQWTVTLSDIAEWPENHTVDEFRLRTGHDCLAKLTNWDYTLNPHALHVTD
ncbi:unnamed protein product [Rodentolepis nana]|uniref:Transposase n=1 Tax=Rodentolepis nana TaxID=102285 RepID=A0A0R3TFB6_RODNA|nr:unnamed protein product [Rodentolepis nana]